LLGGSPGKQQVEDFDRTRGMVALGDRNLLLLSDDYFSVATQHREDVATSTIMQRRYGYVVTRVATPKDSTITEKTSTNNREEKATQRVQRNTLKASPLRFPPSAFL